MQCPACLNEVDPQSTFCGRCGASLMQPVGASVSPPPAYAAQPVAGSPGLSANAASAIAYLTIIPAIIFLVLEPYNRIPLVRFHSWQSIGLAVSAVVLQIMVAICETMLHFVPAVFLVFSLVHLAIALGLFLAWLLAILRASKGEWFKLPIIGDFAEKQARS